MVETHGLQEEGTARNRPWVIQLVEVGIVNQPVEDLQGDRQFDYFLAWEAGTRTEEGHLGGMRGEEEAYWEESVGASHQAVAVHQPCSEAGMAS